MGQAVSYRKALREWRIYFLVLPALAMIATFAYFPAGSAIYHSFFDWSGGEVKQYIGFDNFRRAWNDSVLWWSFGVIAILVVANVIKLIPSILLAVLIHRLRSARWQYWYRVGVVVPMVVPGLVFLFIWKFFLDPNIGALNQLLDMTGGRALLVWIDQLFGWGIFLPDQPFGWLSQPGLVIPSLILWGFPWIGAVGVLLYLAGLQSIGTEVYEAAEIDGVTSWQRFRHIELPLILTQIRLTLVLLIIGTLQGYGLQLLLLGDNGGPAGRGMVPGLWMYNRAFSSGEFGYACALGLILFAAILILTIINNRFVRVEK
jgi:ABC-type sugar transport system permease subunit